MPHLVNYTGQETLLNSIRNAIKQTTEANEKRNFYAITCYFDSEAVESLSERISKALKSRNAQLTGVYVFVDVGDWFKCRVDKSILIKDIAERTGLDEQKIKFIPINFKNRLFHAKSYALISQKNEKTDERRGFIAVTSGNLTKKGLGLVQESNVEFVKIVKDSESLEDFIQIVKDLKNYKASKRLLDRQDEFLLALRIFSAGHFYHKWEGNLGNEIRFKLTLTDEGMEEYNREDSIFQGYKPDSKSISRDPINLKAIFDNIPKPFPKRFWAIYSVDTLLGRWVPKGIASVIDEVLKKSVEPYIRQIESITDPENLENEVKELGRKVKSFKDKDYIKEEAKDVIDAWLERIKRFRDNKELITLRIHNYEKIPEMIYSANRNLISKTFEQLQSQIEMLSKPKGLKAIIKKAIKNEDDGFEQELEHLRKSAEKMLSGKINTKNKRKRARRLKR